jgi:hypothetical protein
LRSLRHADVQAKLAWRQQGHSGTPPGCPGDVSLRAYCQQRRISYDRGRGAAAMGRLAGAHKHGNNWFVNGGWRQ